MTRRFTDSEQVPDLILERYRLGEMTPDDVEAFEQRLQGDDELTQRLQALASSDEEIRRRYPPAVLAAQVRQRFDASAARARNSCGGLLGVRWGAVAALAGALAVATIVAPSLLSPRGEQGDRIKGLEPTLLLFRKTARGSEPLADGATARTGDLIRIGYRAAGHAWGVIVSVDARGVVTRHLPREGERAARLGSESQVLLDVAYELDDAPRWERFYLVVGSAPFGAAAVVDAARRAASSGAAAPPPVLSLGASVRQSSVLLIKEERHENQHGGVGGPARGDGSAGTRVGAG